MRGALVLLIAGTGLGFAGGSARAEGAAAELDAGGSGQREPKPTAQLEPKLAAPDTRPSPDRSKREAWQEAWWSHARDVLFRDLQLSAEQVRGVDAIIESQREELRSAEELRAELEAARERGDTQRTTALRTQLRASRAKRKGPPARIEEMRTLLSEAQRSTFDMNRARLVAERQKTRQARQGTRAKRPRADAGAAAK